MANQKVKILLIEDDALMVRMYQAKFQNEGYEVLVALNGEEGLRKVKETKPDLILLDIMMPKMDGFRVLEILKENLETAEIPVIIFTNIATTDKDIERAKSLGVKDYIIKANTIPREVVDKIKNLLA